MTDAAAPYRVVLADDHPLLRESIATFIEDHVPARLRVVAQAADGLGAVEAVQKHDPHLVLLDLSMPRLDGLGAIGRIKALRPGIRILVLSSFDDQAHVLDAIRAGADDYLFKKYATAEVVVANLLRALGEKPPSQDGPFKKLIESVRGAGWSSADGIAAGTLTGLEVEILKCLAYEGLTAAETIERLRKSGAEISEEALSQRLNAVLEKLGARSAAHAVCLAVRQNILSADEARPAG